MGIGDVEHAVRGWFVGLATLDVVSHVERAPEADEKVTATWQSLAGGGPALNAAVVFAALGGDAVLVTRLGEGPVADLVRADLVACGVRLVDMAAPGAAPPVSTITVESDGTRRVVGLDAMTGGTDDGPAGPGSGGADVGPAGPGSGGAGSVARGSGAAGSGGLDAPGELGKLGEMGTAPDVVLLDGHHPDLAEEILDRLDGEELARILDAGRWKPQFTRLLPRCTHVVASAGFRLDGHEETDTVTDRVEAILQRIDARSALAAVTGGAGDLVWGLRDADGRRERGCITPPRIDAVDTLGAGDALHGAYAWALAAGRSAPLEVAVAVASHACTYRGTRAWLPTAPRIAEEAETSHTATH